MKKLGVFLISTVLSILAWGKDETKLVEIPNGACVTEIGEISRYSEFFEARIACSFEYQYENSDSTRVSKNFGTNGDVKYNEVIASMAGFSVGGAAPTAGVSLVVLPFAAVGSLFT